LESTTISNRKSVILDSALKLLAERGSAGLTHRAVDELSGLPQGSTSYYFPKRATMFEAAAHHLIEILNEDCVQTQIRFSELVADGRKNEAIDYVADELLKYADEARTVLLARIEITLAAARDAELVPLGVLVSEAARQPIEFFVKLLSRHKTDHQIATCMGLLVGVLLLYVTGQGPKPSSEQIRQIFRSVKA